MDTLVEADSWLGLASDAADEIDASLCLGIDVAREAIQAVIRDADSSLGEAEEGAP
jgi:hypothetical protein